MSRTLLNMIVAGMAVCAVPACAFAQQAGAPAAPARPTAGGVSRPVGGPITSLPIPAEGVSASPPSAPAGQTATPTTPVDSAYPLGVGDIVELTLVGRSDFGGRARVSTDGTILLPYVGAIKAADLTVMDLADIIRQALIKGGFFADPVVRIEVVGISSRYITALGAVGSPGLIALDRNYRLSEMMAKLGGKSGSGANFVMLTHIGGKPERYSYDKLANGSAEDDPIVQSGDKIFIPLSDSEVFYLQGEVNGPGAYPVTDGLTVRTALAKAGGVTANGSEKKVKITRDGKLLKGAKLDDPVKVGDVIAIGERLF